MSYIIEPLAKLTAHLSSLPGIGGKTAQRLAYHIITKMCIRDREKMADTVALLKKEGYSGGIMVGGAVVTPEFAQELGVHYSSDAAQAVTLAKALVGLK